MLSGLSTTYFTFTAIAVLALAYIYYTVPETKGKTLEEIEALWLPAAPVTEGTEAEGN